MCERGAIAWIRGGAAVCLGATTLLGLLAVAPRAEARSALDRLRDKGCPAYLVPDADDYSRREVRSALRGRFRIYRGREARLRPPVNWRKDPYGKRGFRERLHSFRWVDVLLFAYRRGNLGALRRARNLALDYVRQNRRGARAASPLAWFNKTVGFRTPYLAYVARAAACEGVLRAGQARTLVRSLAAHGRFLAGRGYFPSNHGLFMDTGLLLLADRYLPFLGRANRWKRLARHRFPRTMAGRLSKGGAWLEHSFGYHFLVIRLARRFLDLGGAQKRTAQLLRAMKATAPWMVGPDGRLAQIGDTDRDRAPAWARRRASKIGGLRFMPRAGLAVVREGDSYLAVAAGFHNRSHKHADELTFELHEHGKRVVTGPGKYGFDRNARRRYVLSSRAHSVLTVAGKSFPRRGPYGGALTAARRDGDYYVISGRNPLLADRGVEHTRVFLYDPGKTLAVEDRVSASRPRKLARFFQLGPKMRIRRHPAGLDMRARRFRGCLIDEPYGPGRQAKRRLVKGQRRPIRGFTFPKVEKAVPRWTVSYASRATVVRHLTVFDLDDRCRRRGGVDGVVDGLLEGLGGGGGNRAAGGGDRAAAALGEEDR